MTVVKYTDTKGFMWAVDVPEGTSPEQYKAGVRLGPPDLSRLNLGKDQWLALNTLLVEHGLYNAPQLMGKRLELKQILQKCGISTHLLNTLIGVYQEVYYGEMEK